MSAFADLILTDEERTLIETWRQVKGFHVKSGPLPKATMDEALELFDGDSEAAQEYVDQDDPADHQRDHERAIRWCSAIDKLLAVERLVRALDAPPTSVGSDPQ